MGLSDQTPTIQGATDGTEIGNILDTLKISVHDSAGTAITSTLNTGKQSLDVNVTSPISVTTGIADKTTFTYGTSLFQSIGGVYQDTSPTLTSGQSGVARLTEYRALHINLRTIAGVEIGTSGSPLRIDPTGSTAQPVTDNGGSLTIDGTVAATQSGTWTVQPGNTANTTPWLTRLHDGTDASQITTNGDLEVVDYLDHSGTQGTVSVTTSATAIRVGGSNLTNRKMLTIYNDSSRELYWGFTSGVTTANGTTLEKKQFLALAVGPNTTIYMIATTGSNTVRITEAA